MKLISAAFIVAINQNDLWPNLVLFPDLKMFSPSKPDNVFLKAATGFSANPLLDSTYGDPAGFLHTPQDRGSGRKLYLSETPSIGWEAKTLGASERISSSEIATAPRRLEG